MDHLAILERDGRVWLRGACPADELAVLAQKTSVGAKPGTRIDIGDSLKAVLRDGAVGRAISSLHQGMEPVRAVVFDKSPVSNWGVPWHQDRVIRVAARDDSAPVTNWSLKAGAWHCEPDENFLRGMLFVRVHTDGCDGSNGAMELALGSHREGIVPAAKADQMADRCETEIAEALPGDILVMSMLLLHRSRPALSERSRRAVRVDYAAGPPPAPLMWA